MPASRAILRDISENGLDPRTAHTRCTQDGRLARPTMIVTCEEKQVLEHVVDEVQPSSEQTPIQPVVDVPIVDDKPKEQIAVLSKKQSRNKKLG